MSYYRIYGYLFQPDILIFFIFIMQIKIKFIYNNLINYSKDVRLPVQLQRAMAAEAEAAREARAKVS